MRTDCLRKESLHPSEGLPPAPQVCSHVPHRRLGRICASCSESEGSLSVQLTPINRTTNTNYSLCSGNKHSAYQAYQQCCEPLLACLTMCCLNLVFFGACPSLGVSRRASDKSTSTSKKGEGVDTLCQQHPNHHLCDRRTLLAHDSLRRYGVRKASETLINTHTEICRR
jgi:hypothetical protein